MNRRELLGLFAASLAVPGLGLRDALAEGRAGRSGGGGTAPRLVLVELAGANDGLNTLVPRENDHYRRLRPTIGLAPGSLLALDDVHGLHPALAALRPSLDAGDLAIVQGLGYPRPNRSHFRSIALWERAGDGACSPPASGWITHAVEHGLGERQADAEGLSLAGGLTLFASDSGRWLSAESVAQLLRRESACQPVAAIEHPHISRVASRVSRLDATLADIAIKLERAPGMPPLAANALGEQLRQVARCIVAGLDVPVYRVRLEGFDTHDDQRARHARLLRQLADALAGFRTRMVALGEWDATVMATYSEFGRRAGENASGGTDHGTAAPHLVLGGRVDGGLLGDATDLAPAALIDGDPVHTMDYRALYEALLKGALGAEDAHLRRFRDPRLAPLFARV